MSDSIFIPWHNGLLDFDEDIEQKYIFNEETSEDINEFLKWSKDFEGYRYRTLADQGGLEFVYAAENDFKEFDVSGQDLAGCVDGDCKSIREVCRKILSHIAKARTLEKQGESHLVSRNLEPSRAAIHAFILAAFDGMERYQTYQPIPELHYLLKEILSPGVSALEKAIRAENRKHSVLFLASEIYKVSGDIPSLRTCAQAMRLSPSTVSRMFDGVEDYEANVKRWASFRKSLVKHTKSEN